MREISSGAVTASVCQMCAGANMVLPEDIAGRIRECREREPWPAARDTLDKLCQNMDIARREAIPLCQDTGMACVFLALGQDARIVGGDLYEAVHEGIRQGYAQGYLRRSVVADPLRRKNTGDNTPALIHTDIVPGDRLTITLSPKGFGSENMSRLAMLTPAAGAAGVKDFVVETVSLAGPNPCPPIVVGVGIGGSFDQVALLAKKALLRGLDEPHPDPYYREMELELWEKINRLGIGPQGFGGQTTALGVSIETLPTHIAGLPVAVNISCHATRRVSVVL
ncbi:MAG: fumarate hydratase [Peptococcaceae bacterium]|nr:fumarate hydratase [Peptococcaceae bacterium]